MKKSAKLASSSSYTISSFYKKKAHHELASVQAVNWSFHPSSSQDTLELEYLNWQEARTEYKYTGA